MATGFEVLTLLYFPAAFAVALPGAFILGKAPESRLHQVFFLSTLTRAFWNVSEFVQHSPAGTPVAGIWVFAELIRIVDAAVASTSFSCSPETGRSPVRRGHGPSASSMPPHWCRYPRHWSRAFSRPGSIPSFFWPMSGHSLCDHPGDLGGGHHLHDERRSCPSR